MVMLITPGSVSTSQLQVERQLRWFPYDKFLSLSPSRPAVRSSATRWCTGLSRREASFVGHVFSVMALPNYPRNTLDVTRLISVRDYLEMLLPSPVRRVKK